jgi:hypothetical protein
MASVRLSIGTAGATTVKPFDVIVSHAEADDNPDVIADD